MDDAAKPVPLTSVYDPPATLPDVELQRWGSRPEVVQRGIRYAGEWIVDGQLQRLAEVRPLPWPEAVSVDGADGLFVSFGAVPLPEFVEVRIFNDEVDGDDTPTGPPMVALECALRDPGTKRCIETRGSDVGVALQVPAGGIRHVTVWASWDVPSALAQRLGVHSHDVYASWLFKIRS